MVATRDADAIITISAAARADISDALGIAGERLDVIHLGAGRPAVIAPTPAAELRARHRLAPGTRVVLCVGAKRPHKNQGLLVDALPLLPPDVVLVLAGYEEPYADELRERSRAIARSRPPARRRSRRRDDCRHSTARRGGR